MIEKSLNRKYISFIFFLGTVLIIFCLLFIYHNLRAALIYDQILSLQKPSLRSELKDYYSRVFNLLSKLLKYSRYNPEYLASKADYIIEAIEDGFAKLFSVDSQDAEDLYTRAVELDPIDFEYHLKYGWFYVGRDSQKAEEGLKKAIALYPTDYQPYLYLGKYYLRQQREKDAFINLILSLSYAEEKKNKVVDKLRDDLNKYGKSAYELIGRKISYTIYPKKPEFYLKKEGFPQAKIFNLRFIVYIKNKDDKVTLYKGQHPYASFKKIKSTLDYDVYSFKFRKFKDNEYIDDFKIQTDFGSPIEKIAIVKYF